MTSGNAAPRRRGLQDRNTPARARTRERAVDYYGDVEVEGRCMDTDELVTRNLRLVAFNPAPSGLWMRVVRAVPHQQGSGHGLADVQGKFDYKTADPRVHLHRWVKDGEPDFTRWVAARVPGVTDGLEGLWAVVKWSSSVHPVVAWAVHEFDHAEGSSRVALPVGCEGGSILRADLWGAARAARVHQAEFEGTELVREGNERLDNYGQWVAEYAVSEDARHWLPIIMNMDIAKGARKS